MTAVPGESWEKQALQERFIESWTGIAGDKIAGNLGRNVFDYAWFDLARSGVLTLDAGQPGFVLNLVVLAPEQLAA
jgi:hypothetical protein